jgi:hypothetical protein
MASYLQKVEEVFADWGLRTPGKRLLVGAALGTVAIWALQPKAMFHNGYPRPFSAWSDGPDSNGTKPTSYPWWLGPIAGMFVLGMLI